MSDKQQLTLLIILGMIAIVGLITFVKVIATSHKRKKKAIQKRLHDYRLKEEKKKQDSRDREVARQEAENNKERRIKDIQNAKRREKRAEKAKAAIITKLIDSTSEEHKMFITAFWFAAYRLVVDYNVTDKNMNISFYTVQVFFHQLLIGGDLDYKFKKCNTPNEIRHEFENYSTHALNLAGFDSKGGFSKLIQQKICTPDFLERLTTIKYKMFNPKTNYSEMLVFRVRLSVIISKYIEDTYTDVVNSFNRIDSKTHPRYHINKLAKKYKTWHIGCKKIKESYPDINIETKLMDLSLNRIDIIIDRIQKIECINREKDRPNASDEQIIFEWSEKRFISVYSRAINNETQRIALEHIEHEKQKELEHIANEKRKERERTANEERKERERLAAIESEKQRIKASAAGKLIELSIEPLHSGNNTQAGIYIIVNNKSLDFYIGESQNMNLRRKAHLGDLLDQNHHSKLMQEHFNLYGKDIFDFYSLERNRMSNTETRKYAEERWIKEYQPSYNTIKGV